MMRNLRNVDLSRLPGLKWLPTRSTSFVRQQEHVAVSRSVLKLHVQDTLEASLEAARNESEGLGNRQPQDLLNPQCPAKAGTPALGFTWLRPWEFIHSAPQ